MRTLKKIFVLILALLLAAFGISLQLKAGIGVAPFDALNQSLGYAFNIKVGDVVTFVQFFFVIVQVLILKRNTKWTILLQVFVGALLGQFVNLFYYNVLGNLVVDNYLLSLLLLIFGSLWIPIFIGSVMVLDLVTMPVESFAMVVSNQVGRSFGQVRQYCDILFLIISLILTFALKLPFTIREGTVISAFTFGPLLSLYMPLIENFFRKMNIINEAKTEN